MINAKNSSPIRNQHFVRYEKKDAIFFLFLIFFYSCFHFFFFCLSFLLDLINKKTIVHTWEYNKQLLVGGKKSNIETMSFFRSVSSVKRTLCSSTIRLTQQQQPLITCTSERFFSSASVLCSGHSKWSTIKHDKAKNDAAKNKMATKFSSQITIAVKCKFILGDMGNLYNNESIKRVYILIKNDLDIYSGWSWPFS